MNKLIFIYQYLYPYHGNDQINLVKINKYSLIH